MKTPIALLTLLFGAAGSLLGQATPTATAGTTYNPGPALPLIDGNFQYALTGSEIVQFNNNGSQGTGSASSTSSITVFSGNMEYLGKSTVHPFSMLYAGGVYISSYAGQGTTTFQSLTASQGLVAGRWAMGVSDSVSYLPQSPTTGITGIPGIGDLGYQTLPDPSLPAQSVLTNYGSRISNTISGNIERQLTGRTSLTGSGSYGILRFISGEGYSSDQITGQVGLNHQIDRRSSVSLTAVYSIFTYNNTPTSMQSRGLNLGYSRTLTKELSMSVSAGPQWTNSYFAQLPGTAASTGVAVPSTLNAAATASLSYTHKHVGASLGYSRGVNAGSGVLLGGVSDSLSGSVQRAWGRNWSAAVTGAYSRTRSIGGTTAGSSNAIVGGTQVSRRLGQNFSTYGSYTYIYQTVPAYLVGQNAFNGRSQSIGVGITFAPRTARLGQF